MMGGYLERSLLINLVLCNEVTIALIVTSFDNSICLALARGEEPDEILQVPIIRVRKEHHQAILRL
jgi:hypothetical protein